MCPKACNPTTRDQSLAELGFIVVQIDGMGTSNRSKKFHDVCFKNLGDAGLPDRIAWIARRRQSIRTWTSREWAFSADRPAVKTRPERSWPTAISTRSAVADCGCHDNRMDKIWWNEQWMGWPVGPEYAESSNVTYASRLSGKLLLIVGEMDTNVDPASTMQVVNALIKADKDFDLLVIPGSNHGAAETPYGSRRRAGLFRAQSAGVEPRER